MPRRDDLRAGGHQIRGQGPDVPGRLPNRSIPVGRAGKRVARTVSTGQLAAAMEQDAIRGKSDDELLELLERLCTRMYLENNRHLPIINQCISINAEPLNRYYRDSSRSMAGLAVVAVLLGVGQLCMFLIH